MAYDNTTIYLACQSKFSGRPERKFSAIISGPIEHHLRERGFRDFSETRQPTQPRGSSLLWLGREVVRILLVTGLTGQVPSRVGFPDPMLFERAANTISLQTGFYSKGAI